MSYKVNFHCHTKFSDGADMEKLVIEYKQRGFCCAIFTDHIYPGSIEKEYSNTRKKYTEQLALGKELSEKYDIPVIVGAEIGLWFEEVLVFNPETIYSVFDIIDNSPKDQNVFVDMFKKFPELIKNGKDFPILCHPAMHFMFEGDKTDYKHGMSEEKLIDLIDNLKGYEKFNNGSPMFKNREFPKILEDKVAFSNSDCHSLGDLRLGYNFSPIKIEKWEDILKITELENKTEPYIVNK